MNDERPRCQATSKQTGERCKNPPIRGARNCRFHGGRQELAHRGTGNQNYKHGKYSRYRSERLNDRIEAMSVDPDLLSQITEIKIVTALLDDHLDRVDAGASLPLWSTIDRAFRDFEVAASTKDRRALEVHRAKLRETIDAGLDAASSSVEARALIEQRRKLVESERKRIIEAGQALALDQALGLFEALQRIVLEEVNDPAALQRIRERSRHVWDTAGAIDAESMVRR